MPKTEVTFYERLVYVVYGYFILLAAAWLILSFLFGKFFNLWAFFTLAIFIVQAYYKHRLTNLIVGILGLAVSIFWLLEFTFLGQQAGYNLFVAVMLGAFILSLISSGILIFSYTKLSFKDR